MSSPKTSNSIFHNFLEAITNLFIFLPYFFSINILASTLFAPWKNLKSKRTIRYFSFADVFNRFMFDFISRTIGFFMRISILFFYLIVQTLYILLVPIALVVFVFAYPILHLMRQLSENDTEYKNQLKADFISKHMLDEANYTAVEQWYEYIYENRLKRVPWWKLSNLLSIPPLARDWASGYTPTLDSYANDLTSTSYQLSIRSHIIGREKESQQLERVLLQSEEANAILVGEEGVGKHTIINALAKKMYEGKTNNLLAYKRLLQINMEKVLTKYSDRKKQEEFFEELLLEAAESKNVVLLIDNMDRYVAEGEGRIDLSNSLEKYANTQHIQIIGITNPFLYEKYIYPNDKIRNLFSKVDVDEVSKQTAYTILLDQAITFENKYDITIPYETLLAILDKGSYYITSIPFPEKALQLLDWISVYAIQTLKDKTITPKIVDEVITSRTHAPTSLSRTIKQKLLHLEELLQSQILGQDEAIRAISSSLRRAFLLLGKRKKPIASFLFLGPTGVGKTETSKVISQVFFGDESKLIRFDMSLYQSKEDIPKLIGSIETLNPGLLTNEIRENPYGVLLIDEIEKAHKDLLNIFLTVLDEGYFTDGFGQRVDCKNLVIIATSNAGAADIHQLLVKQSLYTGGEGGSSDTLINYLIEKRYFSPEFLNRFDGIVAYKPLQENSAAKIAQNIVRQIQQEILELHKVKIEVSDNTINNLINKGYNATFGVRNLERIIRQHIEDRVAFSILEEKVKPGDTLRI